MTRPTTRHSAVIAIIGSLLASTAYGFDFGNMMNPSKWMNNNDNDYDDDYYGGPGGYGYGAPPPGYYGAPGYGGYGAPGYGGYPAPGYGGYPAPGYGAPGYNGAYSAPGQAPANSYGPDHDLPDTHAGYEQHKDKAEIARLKERIRELEQASAPAPAPSYGYGNNPPYQASQPAYGSQPYDAPATTPQPAQPGSTWSNQPPYQYRQQ